MTENERKRIEEKAETYADSIDRRGCAFWQGLYRGYIAGALAIESEARSAVIDEAANVETLDECIKVLETFKAITNG